jgi:hypothetical protein
MATPHLLIQLVLRRLFGWIDSSIEKFSELIFGSFLPFLADL